MRGKSNSKTYIVFTVTGEWIGSPTPLEAEARRILALDADQATFLEEEEGSGEEVEG